MFVHAVYFWLKEGLTQEELAQFQEGINSLTTIESVQLGHVGVPADTDREVIDSSYSYALVVTFADQQGHDDYQVHPVHDKFRETCAPFWTRVQIYDSVG